jgi:hypothetical protein
VEQDIFARLLRSDFAYVGTAQPRIRLTCHAMPLSCMSKEKDPMAVHTTQARKTQPKALKFVFYRLKGITACRVAQSRGQMAICVHVCDRKSICGHLWANFDAVADPR